MTITAREMTGICVIGAGPAGTVLATRLSQLGHHVSLIERATFPRARLGESLSPGVLPLLETIGARQTIESAGFRRVHSVRVRWGAGPEERRDPREQGLLVDRGRFDSLLLDCARAHGVRVWQPAAIRKRRRDDEGWTLQVEAGSRSFDLRTPFLADATGRAASLAGRRRRTGRRTFALYGYWRGRGLPDQPRIEAGADEWYWGVPLPDDSYNTLVFVDGNRLRHQRAAAAAGLFRELIGRSGLMDGCRDARLAGPVLAADATPYVDEESVTPGSLKVGDAALAIDPLSSSGVQKAIQSALAGAVVVNTLLRKPERNDAAMQFYRESLAHASERHRRWAAAHYRTVAVGGGGSFWNDRAGDASTSGEGTPPAAADKLSAAAVAAVAAVADGVELSPRLELVDVPCLDGEFVAVKPALRHPGLDGPVAFLGGWEVAPLLRQLQPGMTLGQVARSWSPRVPPSSGLAITRWLLDQGIIVPRGSDRPSAPALVE